MESSHWSLITLIYQKLIYFLFFEWIFEFRDNEIIELRTIKFNSRQEMRNLDNLKSISNVESRQSLKKN